MKIISFNPATKSYIFDSGHFAIVDGENLIVYRKNIKLKPDGKGFAKVALEIIKYMKKEQNND